MRTFPSEEALVASSCQPYSSRPMWDRGPIDLASVAQTKPSHARCSDVTRAFKLMEHWRQLGGVRDYVAKFTKDASNSDLGFRCVTANILRRAP